MKNLEEMKQYLETAGYKAYFSDLGEGKILRIILPLTDLLQKDVTVSVANDKYILRDYQKQVGYEKSFDRVEQLFDFLENLS